MSNKIVVVAGPTASGKTRLGIELAKKYGGEIVSADSMQLYRGMDIGTAKATKEERAAAPHHMLDAAEPSEAYSVARYVEEAGQVCDEILSRGKLPIVVGGTGLYIDSLIAGRDCADTREDRALRTELEAADDRLGRLVRVERDVVDVEFDGVGAGGLQTLREGGPLLGGRAVDAGDDGHDDLLAQRAQQLDVLLGAEAHGEVGAQVVEGGGGAGVAQVVVDAGDLLADLLLEGRAHDDGADAGLLQMADGVDGAGEGGAGGDEGVAEFEAEIGSLE